MPQCWNLHSECFEGQGLMVLKVKIRNSVKLFDKVKSLCYIGYGGTCMKNYTEQEIEKLQDNLLLIRKAGGWSAEEFGDMIGVTKQTISNLENKKTKMTKTQYIAIRAVLDYEIAERTDSDVLSSAVNISLNSDDLSEIDRKKAQAFIEGAAKTGLDSAALIAGLGAIIGSVVFPLAATTALSSGAWLAKILKKKK